MEANSKESFVTMPDGVRIRYVSSNEDDAKRFLVFVNGRTEWIEKYSKIAEWLELSESWGVLRWDHRGQGGSGGPRSFVKNYEDFADDAQAVISEVCGGRPYYIVSHSMGGLISLYATLTGKITPKALVLSSPLFLLPSKPLPRWVARPVASLFSLIGFGEVGTGAGKHDRASFDGNKLTHDLDAFERIIATPYPIGSATFAWVRATFKAIEQVFSLSNIKKLSCPVLVLTGGDERVVDVTGKDNWCEAVKKAMPNLRLESITIPGGRHELFSESPKYRNQAISAIKDFLSKVQS